MQEHADVIEYLRRQSKLPAEQFDAQEYLPQQVPLERLQDLASLAPHCAGYYIDMAVELMAPGGGMLSLIWLLYYMLCTCMHAWPYHAATHRLCQALHACGDEHAEVCRVGRIGCMSAAAWLRSHARRLALTIATVPCGCMYACMQDAG